ncbi:MAG: class I SAM-dependent methyltransferase, partial [Bacteroidota bacterium]
MNLKGTASNTLRAIGLTPLVDRVRYTLMRRKNQEANAAFVANHPEVKLPPDYLMYESFRLDYQKYFYGGKETAAWLVDLILKHTVAPEPGFSILDWGCGPGRVVRHLQDLLPIAAVVHGTDYNPATIAWCKQALPTISFNHNELAAKLPYPDGTFDAIYGISIFTHLSEALHHDWIHELRRVLKPGGLLLLTMQGNNFKAKLSPSELSAFERGELVVRGSVKEGHRTYSAFHPDAYLQNLFQDFTVLEQIIIDGRGKDY